MIWKLKPVFTQLKIKHRIIGVLEGRYLRYFVGYFWIFMRFLRLKFPGLLIYRIIFNTFIPKRIESSWNNGDLLSIRLNTFEPEPLKVSQKYSHKRVALALPSTAVRFGSTMEGEMLFAYKNSLLAHGINPLVLDTSLQTYSVGTLKQKMLTSLLEEKIDILVLQGDSMLTGSSFLDNEFVQSARNHGIAIVVDLVDCFVTRGGQVIVDFYLDKADFIIFHNSRLELKSSHLERSLIWPSLPYPEKFFLERHVSKTEALLIPGSSHRGRIYFANYSEYIGLDWKSGLFSNSNSEAANFSYSEYVNSISRARLLFTNGYKNRKESQVIGRVSETMLANTTLLYESGSDIDFFFTPYQEYVPIFNLPDYAEKVRYLLKNPQIAQGIANRGLQRMLSSYSTSTFWNRIFQQVA